MRELVLQPNKRERQLKSCFKNADLNSVGTLEVTRVKLTWILLPMFAFHGKSGF